MKHSLCVDHGHLMIVADGARGLGHTTINASIRRPLNVHHPTHIPVPHLLHRRILPDEAVGVDSKVIPRPIDMDPTIKTKTTMTSHQST